MQHLLSLIHTPDIVGYIEKFNYIGVFVWFTIFDFVAPFPDEISLLTVGYLASMGYFNPFLVASVPIFSFLLTDSISFFLARSGISIFGHRKRRMRKHSFRAFISRNLDRHLGATIIAACFIPRMRMWGPIVAGSTKVPYRKFIAYDAIGVGLFVALYTNLGYFFGVSLSTVFSRLRMYQTPIFVALVLVLGLFLLYLSGRLVKKEHNA